METKETRMLDIATDDKDIVQVELAKSPAGYPIVYININGVCQVRLVDRGNNFEFRDSR